MTNLAFVFPGQGSQQPGMGKALYDDFKQARLLIEEGSDALSVDLAKLIFESDAEALKLTENTQPAVLSVSAMVMVVIETETNMVPAAVAGHSLGEYSALVAAKAIKYADAVRAVRDRGRFMQEAVPEGRGAMAAVLGLDREKVAEVCNSFADKGVIEPANYNCPGQIVISGEAGLVDAAAPEMKNAGAKGVIKLPVSAPFHCKLMKPAADRLAETLSEIEFSKPAYPVYTNVEALPNTNPERIRPLLIEQVTAPVLWEDSVIKMIEAGIEHFYEIGPGEVLSGLIKRIDRRVGRTAICSTESIKQIAD